MSDMTILLVEDNREDQSLTLRALKKNNISNKVIVARDGTEALAYLRTDERELPALVLLDLKLPKVDGLEVLRRVRGEPRTRLLPVVVLTTSKEEQDLLRSYDLDANSYVRKPVDFEQFSETVCQPGLSWLVLNEPPPQREGTG